MIISACYWAAVVVFDIPELPLKLDRLLLLTHGLYFGIGIALSSTDRLWRSPLQLALIAVGFILAAVEIRFSMIKYGLHDLPANAWIAPYAIWIVSVSAIGLTLRYRTVVSAFVEPRVYLAGLLRTLGLATYPLYLVHIHVAGLVMTVVIAGGFGVVPALIAAHVVTVVASVAIARYGEPAARRISSKFLLPIAQRFSSIVANRASREV